MTESKKQKINGKVKESKDPVLVEEWRRLQSSDHYYYMCTKWFADGDVHKYFSPHESPYEAFIAFMNVLNDIIKRIDVNISNKQNGVVNI